MSLICLIVDRSDSMLDVCDEAIKGMNIFLDRQSDDSTILALLFNDRLEWLTDAPKPVKELTRFNRDNYVPRGCTALYDAIVGGINHTRKQDFKGKIYLVIQTDGHENSSIKYTKHNVNAEIAKARDDGWEVIFLGADQDAIASAQSLGIPGTHAISYRQQGNSTTSTVWGCVADNIQTQQLSRGTTFAFSQVQRDMTS